MRPAQVTDHRFRPGPDQPRVRLRRMRPVSQAVDTAVPVCATRRCNRYNGANADAKGIRARAAKPRQSPSRGGFDKATLAAVLIGLMRAGQKAARSANKRTGRRSLSNPPLRIARC
jgi:hypothetical protein